jgi:hypothetical protein
MVDTVVDIVDIEGHLKKKENIKLNESDFTLFAIEAKLVAILAHWI